ncbi:MAG TPA: alanine racemase, partial [Cyclobacteriaceae bacterium]|nr:alanine racemase [Cyclobacteriaceae bacterium]
DSYNSDLGSLAIALDFLNQQKQHPKKTLILSDILQSGYTNESLYKEVAALIDKKGISRLIGIGPGISGQSELFQVEKSFYPSTPDFLSAFNNALFHNETILLKGARIFGFEAISKVIQQKAHETVLEINLNSIVHNLNYFRSKVKAETRIMAMVKAFSYGSGSFEIANILQFHRVDYLAVAYADEGVELRKAGITMPIMVMNPEEQSYDAMILYNLEPEIYSFRVLNLFEETLKRSERPNQQPVFIHLKLDTGMHRLGFEEADINELIVRIQNNKQLHIKSIFSHLAASDEPEHDEFTWQQIRSFTAMSEKIKGHFSYPIHKHILNSAGVSRFPDAQFDMVRLGIGLYGIGANSTEQLQLQNVSTLKTSISQIKNIPANETIGYSRKGIAMNDMQIATVPIGYADGLNRRLSNGKGKMIIKGKVAPIVGNVCMDMCMIDITDIAASENDEVIVFGIENPITEVAKDIGTIPYEVLTNISRRVKRVYFQE